MRGQSRPKPTVIDYCLCGKLVIAVSYRYARVSDWIAHNVLFMRHRV